MLRLLLQQLVKYYLLIICVENAKEFSGKEFFRLNNHHKSLFFSTCNDVLTVRASMPVVCQEGL